ncbi:MAG TPA: RDD family protein [Alphaproteobacteria bacterium]|nr:RDD family protein [Alphaproteobacteria bacterium]
MPPNARRSSDSGQPPFPPGVHLVVGGADSGPLDFEAFRKLADQGAIGPDTLAWYPALQNWTEIAQVPDLAQVLAPPTLAERPAEAPALARLPRRLGAGVVDLVIWLGLVGLLSVPLGLTPILTGTSDDPQLAQRFDLLAQGTAAVYYVVPMSRLAGGATVGYRLLGLRLVAADTLAPPGVLRTIVWYIVTYVRLVGWLTYFFDSKRRMLHNIISNTLVIVARGSRA